MIKSIDANIAKRVIYHKEIDRYKSLVIFLNNVSTLHTGERVKVLYTPASTEEVDKLLLIAGQHPTIDIDLILLKKVRDNISSRTLEQLRFEEVSLFDTYVNELARNNIRLDKSLRYEVFRSNISSFEDVDEIIGILPKKQEINKATLEATLLKNERNLEYKVYPSDVIKAFLLRRRNSNKVLTKCINDFSDAYIFKSIEKELMKYYTEFNKSRKGSGLTGKVKYIDYNDVLLLYEVYLETSNIGSATYTLNLFKQRRTHGH